MMFSVEMEMSSVFPTIVDALKHVEKNHRDFVLGKEKGGHENGGVAHDDEDVSIPEKKGEGGGEVAVEVGWATVVRQASVEGNGHSAQL